MWKNITCFSRHAKKAADDVGKPDVQQVTTQMTECALSEPPQKPAQASTKVKKQFVSF